MAIAPYEKMVKNNIVLCKGKRMKKIIVLSMILIFIGCGSSENREVTTLKGNRWIGQNCNVSTQLDQDGNPYFFYYKSVYWFKENIITERVTSYADKDCRNSLEKYSDYNLSYYDLGLKESKNGYEIYDIKIEEYSKEQDAFYAISYDRLCFSKSIYGFNVEEQRTDLNGNVYTSYTSGLHIYPSRDNSIDYENCLLKK